MQRGGVADRAFPRGAWERGRRSLVGLFRLLRPADDVEEDRREEDAEGGDADHAAEDGGAQRAAHFGAGAFGQHQRHDAEDEGEGRHDDRPQPQPAGLDGGFVARLSLLVQLLGELDDQNRVLRRQPDQHQEPDLHEDVDRQLRDQHADHRAEQTHRHDQNHRERQPPAFVLGGQDQEDQQRAQGEGDDAAAALLELHVDDFGPFVGQPLFLCQVGHDVHGLARTDARGGVAVDRRRGVHVVAHDHHRPAGPLHVGKRAQRHHLAELVADLQVADLVGLIAERLVGQQVDLPRAAELVEQVDVVPAHVDLERVERVLHVDLERLAFRAVDVEVELGRVGPIDGEQVFEPRVFVAGFDEFVGLGLKFRQIDEAALLDLELEAAGGAQPLDRRRAEHRDHGVGNFAGVNLAQLLRDHRVITLVLLVALQTA